MSRRLDFRAPWASCVTCRGHLAWHDDVLCAQIRQQLRWLAALRLSESM